MPGTNYTVRAARPADARAAAEVHCASAVTAFVGIFPTEAPVPTPESVGSEWVALLADPESDVFVGLYNDRVAGTGGISPDPETPTGMVLTRFYVHPDHWGRGLGGRLYRRTLERARDRDLGELNLWVLEDNPRSRTMYEQLGWRLVPGEYRFVGDTRVRDVLYHRKLI